MSQVSIVYGRDYLTSFKKSPERVWRCDRKPQRRWHTPAVAALHAGWTPGASCHVPVTFVSCWRAHWTHTWEPLQWKAHSRLQCASLQIQFELSQAATRQPRDRPVRQGSVRWDRGSVCLISAQSGGGKANEWSRICGEKKCLSSSAGEVLFVPLNKWEYGS